MRYCELSSLWIRRAQHRLRFTGKHGRSVDRLQEPRAIAGEVLGRVVVLGVHDSREIQRSEIRDHGSCHGAHLFDGPLPGLLAGRLAEAGIIHHDDDDAAGSCVVRRNVRREFPHPGRRSLRDTGKIHGLERDPGVGFPSMATWKSVAARSLIGRRSRSSTEHPVGGFDRAAEGTAGSSLGLLRMHVPHGEDGHGAECGNRKAVERAAQAGRCRSVQLCNGCGLLHERSPLGRQEACNWRGAAMVAPLACFISRVR